MVHWSAWFGLQIIPNQINEENTTDTSTFLDILELTVKVPQLADIKHWNFEIRHFFFCFGSIKHRQEHLVFETVKKLHTYSFLQNRISRIHY